MWDYDEIQNQREYEDLDKSRIRDEERLYGTDLGRKKNIQKLLIQIDSQEEIQAHFKLKPDIMKCNTEDFIKWAHHLLALRAKYKNQIQGDL
jgi:hypothetical protein